MTTARRLSRERLMPNPKAGLRDHLPEVYRFQRMSERMEEAY